MCLQSRRTQCGSPDVQVSLEVLMEDVVRMRKGVRGESFLALSDVGSGNLQGRSSPKLSVGGAPGQSHARISLKKVRTWRSV